MYKILNITLNKNSLHLKFNTLPLPYCIALFAMLVGLLSGCGSDSENNGTALTQGSSGRILLSSNLPVPDNRFSNNYEVLIFGNSHVSSQANLIATLITAGNPNATVQVVNAGGGFLDDKLSQQRRSKLMTNETWTHVILQGQKYSQSGLYSYSSLEAKIWIAKAKQQNITPILFPEHPQRGRTQEGRRVHELHNSIAAEQNACVAPIGLSWDKVLLTMPSLKLHQSDGNHASLTGNLLTAFVFYEVITGNSADLLPYIANINVAESTQQLLGQMASETIQANLPCIFE